MAGRGESGYLSGVPNEEEMETSFSERKRKRKYVFAPPRIPIDELTYTPTATPTSASTSAPTYIFGNRRHLFFPSHFLLFRHFFPCFPPFRSPATPEALPE
eukprot:GHVU01139940.1.p4 GENE.GHVU01139940.1~~GHVU01139940.1.p4  ORF type:complete len:101 (-),score=11.69 GHVU01139940.1:766-1068(-)